MSRIDPDKRQMEIMNLVNKMYPAGEHSLNFSASDLSPGVYFLRMDAAGETWSRKMQVVR